MIWSMEEIRKLFKKRCQKPMEDDILEKLVVSKILGKRRKLFKKRWPISNLWKVMNTSEKHAIFESAGNKEVVLEEMFLLINLWRVINQKSLSFFENERNKGIVQGEMSDKQLLKVTSLQSLLLLEICHINYSLQKVR